MSKLYIGLMSGTSMDGIDAVVVDFTAGAKLIAHHSEPIPTELTATMRQLIQPGGNELDLLGQADHELGLLFAEAAKKLLREAKLKPEDIIAIGSHGQNIRHRPNYQFSFTLQIADPNIIAFETGITTVADFRRRDIAAGGQGAPLAPAFHQQFMSGEEPRVILNIGGIANITLLSDAEITGYDTGPGNCLLDTWIRKNKNQSHDASGAWGASGKILPEVLACLTADPYFKKHAPKSTGTEYFNLTWLENTLTRSHLSLANFKPQDIQATLTELTAQTIADGIAAAKFNNAAVFVCGGGVHNTFLMQRLAALHKGKVASTEELGIAPAHVEALAFAWFAKNTLEKKPSNLPSVTGAKCPVILGGVYYAT